MEYFTLLDLAKEPFSNSPDPEMFFHSSQHQGCLQKLELAIRLKRGLSVVIGDIGTGKSTLCRQLVRTLDIGDKKILTHLLLDPEFTTRGEFLEIILKTLGLACPEDKKSQWQMKDAIKDYLLDQAVANDRIVVLIIDEGQKMPGYCIEILRELLNFETNQHKLLQIVIFAQEEFKETLQRKTNFADRITTLHHLTPLGFRDTRRMIRFRLQQASKTTVHPPKLFSSLAILLIYLLTRGYPRKIVMLCSKITIAVLVKNKRRAGLLDVISSARETALPAPAARSRKVFALATLCMIIAIAGAFFAVSHKESLLAAKPPAIPVAESKASPATPVLPEAAPQPAPPAPPAPAETATEASPDDTNATETASTPAAAQALAPATTEHQLPETLGALPFDKETTLSRMIARIYGRFTNRRLQMVLKANPHITNPDNIAARTLIQFPSDEAPRFTTESNAIWVTLDRSATLDEAYTFMRHYPSSQPAVLIVPQIAQDGTLSFAIVLQQIFTSRSEAEQALQSIDSRYRQQSAIKNG